MRFTTYCNIIGVPSNTAPGAVHHDDPVETGHTAPRNHFEIIYKGKCYKYLLSSSETLFVNFDFSL